MTAALKPYLDDLYNTFDISYLSPDPVEFVHRFKNPCDQEIAALLASSLAYGKVERILTSIDIILSIMNYKPFEFVMSFNFSKDIKKFNGFKHRFNTGLDIACLIYIIQNAIITHGSLKSLFLSGYREDDKNIKMALVKFIQNLLDIDLSMILGSRQDHGIRYLLPSPLNGSACKRANLFLRWMIRRDDNIDFGIWKEVSPSKLIVPLDTHTARISRYIGLTDRKNVTWKMAEEITENLKLLDADDPAKYDFALCRLGILKYCSKVFNRTNCRSCKLLDICTYKILL